MKRSAKLLKSLLYSSPIAIWLFILAWLHSNIEKVLPGNDEVNIPGTPKKAESRVCLSPETNVPWILSGTCQQDEYGVSRVSTDKRSCGFCSSPYLQSIATQLQKYRGLCRGMVIYGVAFGAKYVSYVRDGALLSLDESVCSFHFVLQEDGDVMGSLHQNEILITVDSSRLPYKNMRRNVKIFKFSPLDLFPWADRVIWRDTKLRIKRILPTSYMRYFNNTVERFQSCVSLVSLPIHDASMGPKYEDLDFPEYRAHCDAVVDAAILRPTVSDGLETLAGQCQQNLEYYDSEPKIDGTNFLDRSLIDSAVMVWDLRNTTCRKYVGDLTCTWLDEIHCNSDRDQVSFGTALDATGVKVSEKLANGDQIFFQEHRPMVHIARPDCHWYFQNLDLCYNPRYENMRVAVVIHGTYRRFMFSSLVQHVLGPLVRQSHKVDLFLSLSTGMAEAYRFSGTFFPDPRLDGKVGKDLEDAIIEDVKKVGASVGALYIVDQIDIDQDPMIKSKWAELDAKYPKKNPLEYFPALDLRNDEVRKRNSVGNRNFLRLFRAVENLWENVTQYEKTVGEQYDYVMFLRDDSMWFRDFHLKGVIAWGGDIFIPSCDQRVPPLDPHEISDHVIIARRKVADIFGRYFSNVVNLDLDACAAELPRELSKDGKRGCNTEMILKWVTQVHKLSVTMVGQGYLQFQRVARVQTFSGSIIECFHKYCQSKYDPLIIGAKHAGMKTCKSLETL